MAKPKCWEAAAIREMVNMMYKQIDFADRVAGDGNFSYAQCLVEQSEGLGLAAKILARHWKAAWKEQ